MARNTTWVYVGPVKANAVFQMKIVLRDLRPPIWRRLLVRDDASLEELHAAVQMAFGWTDSHMHEFETAGRRFMPRLDEDMALDMDEGTEDERLTRLSDLSLGPKQRMKYTYDFGDSWEHDISIEKTLSAADAETLIQKVQGGRFTKSTRTPVAWCLAGERAGPLEDSGGPWGYAETCAILADPKHPEHDERKEWAEGFAYNSVGEAGFDPERFDLAAVNSRLKKYLKR